jgi:hypothetical protein
VLQDAGQQEGSHCYPRRSHPNVAMFFYGCPIDMPPTKLDVKVEESVIPLLKNMNHCVKKFESFGAKSSEKKSASPVLLYEMTTIIW